VFVRQSITDSALITQLYIAIAALTTLCLAAIMRERERGALELTKSHARIAAAGAQERRRLEGDLHDRVQNRIVGLLVRLRIAHDRTEQAAPDVADILAGLVHEAEALSEELRRIAHGVAPPLLVARGLVDALRSECALSGVPVEIVAGDVGLSRSHVEAAVYLCCLESIQNAAKHAGSDASVTVRLRREGDELAFSVRDTGVGFDPRATTPGAGLNGFRDRIDAVGGRVKIVTAEGRGTTVTGVVPWPPRAV
jgi:signal transduction histidine kinase